MTVQSIRTKMIPTLRRQGVRKAALFGSFVRGDENTASDIDVLVELPSGKTLLDLVGLKQELEETLKRRVDVVTYRSLHPLLKKTILGEQRVIYDKKRKRLS